jgi:hypothetical protein
VSWSGLSYIVNLTDLILGNIESSNKVNAALYQYKINPVYEADQSGLCTEYNLTLSTLLHIHLLITKTVRRS